MLHKSVLYLIQRWSFSIVFHFNNLLYFIEGKTSTAISLAKKYEAAILTVDQIVVDAISSGNTPSGMKARALCQEAARKRLEELKLLEGDEAEKKPGGLSIEQLTAHTQGTSMYTYTTHTILERDG